MSKEQRPVDEPRRNFLKKVGLSLATLAGIGISGEGIYLLHRWEKARQELATDWEESLSYTSPDSFVKHNSSWLSGIQFGFNVSPEHLHWTYVSKGKEDQWNKQTPQNVVTTLSNMFGLNRGRFMIRMNNSVDVNRRFQVKLDYYQPWLDSFGQKGTKLTLNAGIKVARWPEIHVPEALLHHLYPKGVPGKGYVIATASPLGSYTLNSYYPELFSQIPEELIETIQTENEPLSAFGEREWRMDEAYVLDAISVAHAHVPHAAIMQNSPVAYGTFRDINHVLVKAHQRFPSLRGKLLSGVNNYYKQPHPRLLGTQFKNEVIFENLMIAEVGWQLFDSVYQQKQRLADYGIQVIASELQAEPWAPYTSPGNSFSEFMFALLRARRLLEPFNTEKRSDIFVWGIEELLVNHEEISHPFHQEHQDIITLMQRVNAL